MFFKTIFTFTLAATSVLAWPVAKRDGFGGGDDGPSITGTFTPKATYNYDVATGAIECGPRTNRVAKSVSDGGRHTTTLLTFEYPAASAGRLCRFGFRLGAADALSGDRGGLVDLFSSLAPAPGCTTGWGPGNRRDLPVGRLRPVLGGDAAFVDTFTTYLTEPSPCRAPGTVEAFELVGVYDDVHVEWEPSVSGAFISY